MHAFNADFLSNFKDVRNQPTVFQKKPFFLLLHKPTLQQILKGKTYLGDVV